MTGLDKMISQILEEADAAASQKEADAASRAEAILAEAEQEAADPEGGDRRKI